MAQWSRRLSTEQEILGSSPSRDNSLLAQLVERGSNKPKVNRSKLLWSIFLSPVGGARVVGNPVRNRTGIGEHGNAYIPAGIGSGECALPSFRRFESSCKHRGAR